MSRDAINNSQISRLRVREITERAFMTLIIICSQSDDILFPEDQIVVMKNTEKITFT
jgi:hypothetical protein